MINCTFFTALFEGDKNEAFKYEELLDPLLIRLDNGRYDYSESWLILQLNCLQASESSQYLILLFINFSGDVLVPHYYYVPKSLVEEERKFPETQDRVPGGNEHGDIFLWGQSLYIMCYLLGEYHCLFFSHFVFEVNCLDKTPFCSL